MERSNEKRKKGKKGEKEKKAHLKKLTFI